ncbi:MAG: hypothetical protein ACO3P3_03185 [Candidatus Nanopelagicales bacterium]
MKRIFSILFVLIFSASCSSNTSAPMTLPSSVLTLSGEQSASPIPSETMSESPSGPKTSPSDPEAEIDIDDQAGDGTSLMIDEIEFSLNSVWLLIRSKQGEIFHVELVKYGARKASIRLTKPLASGEYLVSLHSDNGDGNFDITKDPIIRGHEREMAREDFEYTRTN